MNTAALLRATAADLGRSTARMSFFPKHLPLNAEALQGYMHTLAQQHGHSCLFTTLAGGSPGAETPCMVGEAFAALRAVAFESSAPSDGIDAWVRDTPRAIIVTALQEAAELAETWLAAELAREDDLAQAA